MIYLLTYRRLQTRTGGANHAVEGTRWSSAFFLVISLARPSPPRLAS